jgi:hypothetical protein
VEAPSTSEWPIIKAEKWARDSCERPVETVYGDCGWVIPDVCAVTKLDIVPVSLGALKLLDRFAARR